MLSWSQWISGVLPGKWNIVAVGYDSILRQGGLLFGGLAARLYCFCKQGMVHRTLLETLFTELPLKLDKSG